MNFGYGNDILGLGGARFTYDDAMNQRFADGVSAGTVAYHYDGLNSRVISDHDGVKTYEFYGNTGQFLIEHTPGTTQTTVQHVYLGGKRVAQKTITTP